MTEEAKKKRDELAVEFDKASWYGRRTLDYFEFGFDAGYAAAKQESAWQPIETAPKDGTHFDVYGRHFGWNSYGRQTSCWFINGRVQPAHTGPVLSVEPTHWMPLPKPPVDGPLASIKEKE